MPDHIHMLVAIPPKYSVSSFMGYLKGKSALMIFDKHANLKYKFGNRHFWAEGYYVSTVGLNEATIKRQTALQNTGRPDRKIPYRLKENGIDFDNTKHFFPKRCFIHKHL